MRSLSVTKNVITQIFIVNQRGICWLKINFRVCLLPEELHKIFIFFLLWLISTYTSRLGTWRKTWEKNMSVCVAPSFTRQKEQAQLHFKIGVRRTTSYNAKHCRILSIWQWTLHVRAVSAGCESTLQLSTHSMAPSCKNDQNILLFIQFLPVIQMKRWPSKNGYLSH